MHHNTVSGRTRWGLLALTLASAMTLGACATASPDSSSGGAIALTIARPTQPDQALPLELQTAFQEALEETMDEHGVPGAVAGVWIPGQGSWKVAMGFADVENGVPASLDMTWPIRSITKSYTVTIILQLADEGKLSLDDTIDMYVDDITNGDSITLLQLANMSSGVADYVNEEFVEEFVQDPTKIFTLAELNRGVLHAPEQFEPGTEFVYTNANTNLLGAVIEKVTGESFAQVLQERILTPLGQTDTFYMTDVSKWADPHPVGYQPDPETDEWVPQEQNPSIFGPAGAMVSSLDDGHAWAVSLGSGAMLHPETQALREIGHEISSPPYGLYAVGMGETYGWLGHNGEGIGFTAATFYDPESGAVIVVYMNVSNMPDGSHPADHAFRRLASVLWLNSHD